MDRGIEVHLLRSLVSELLHADEQSVENSLKVVAAARRKQLGSASGGNRDGEDEKTGINSSVSTDGCGRCLSAAQGIRSRAENSSSGNTSSRANESNCVPVRDQITLTLFRDVCARAEDRYLQASSPPAGDDGLDFSVWTDHSPLVIPAVSRNLNSFAQPPAVLDRLKHSGLGPLPRKDMEVLSPFKWSEYPNLPVDKDCVAGVCHVAQIKDRLVVATTVKSENLERVTASTGDGTVSAVRSAATGHNLYTRRTTFRAAIFVTDASLRRWQPVAAPHISTSHTVDGLCVERMRSKLLLVVRPCTKSDGPSCVWSLENEQELTLKSAWSPYCVVPAGHRCGTFAVAGNFLVAAGGKIGGGDSAAQRTVDAYDFSRNGWTRWPSLPVPMYAAAPVVFNENQLVLCGGVLGYASDTRQQDDGRSGEEAEMGRFEALSLSIAGDSPAKEWTVFCFMNSPCLAPAAANVYGMLVAHNAGDPANGHVAWWDVTKKDWRRVTALPENCVDSAIIEFCGNLVVIGGEELNQGFDEPDKVEDETYERKFSTKVSAIKIVRRNIDVLSSQRRRSVDVPPPL